MTLNLQKTASAIEVSRNSNIFSKSSNRSKKQLGPKSEGYYWRRRYPKHSKVKYLTRLSLYSWAVPCRVGNSQRIKAIYGIRVVCHSPINHTNILSITQNIPWINVEKIALSKTWMTNIASQVFLSAGYEFRTTVPKVFWRRICVIHGVVVLLRKRHSDYMKIISNSIHKGSRIGSFYDCWWKMKNGD